MIYDENLIARKFAQHTSEMALLTTTWPKNSQPEYEQLTSCEKLIVRNFYDAYSNQHVHKMMIASIESAIMLCFQTALLGFHILQPPLRELDYTTKRSSIGREMNPTGQWIIVNVLLGLIKIAMSGYATFAPITIHQKLRSYFHHQKPAGVFTQLGCVTKAIIQIVASTGYIFLSGSQLSTQFSYKHT